MPGEKESCLPATDSTLEKCTYVLFVLKLVIGP